MTYTRHGHHIPGSGEEVSPPLFVVSCGGPGNECEECQLDTYLFRQENENRREPNALEEPFVPPFYNSHAAAVVFAGIHKMAKDIIRFLPPSDEREIALDSLKNVQRSVMIIDRKDQ